MFKTTVSGSLGLQPRSGNVVEREIKNFLSLPAIFQFIIAIPNSNYHHGVKNGKGKQNSRKGKAFGTRN